MRIVAIVLTVIFGAIAAIFVALYYIGKNAKGRVQKPANEPANKPLVTPTPTPKTPDVLATAGGLAAQIAGATTGDVVDAIGGGSAAIGEATLPAVGTAGGLVGAGGGVAGAVAAASGDAAITAGEASALAAASGGADIGGAAALGTVGTVAGAAAIAAGFIAVGVLTLTGGDEGGSDAQRLANAQEHADHDCDPNYVSPRGWRGRKCGTGEDAKVMTPEGKNTVTGANNWQKGGNTEGPPKRGKRGADADG